jgi:hypothetical protein
MNSYLTAMNTRPYLPCQALESRWPTHFFEQTLGEATT